MAFNVYYFFQLIAIFIMLGWAVYVNYRNGQLNMAPIYTMAVGAYFSAYAVNEWGWPFGLAVIVAAAVGAGAGFVPALGLGRAPAFATAIATMGLIYIAQTVIRNLRFLGGAAGYIGIPRIGYLMPVTWGIVIAFGFFIYLNSVGKYLFLMAKMAIIRCHITDRTMHMLCVVPEDKSINPGLGLFNIIKRF